jgi:glycosyltransferase involved in cell wall biosynthesis
VAERPLHIGIDGRELVGQPTGVGRYLTALLHGWADLPSMPHHFTTILPADPPADLAALGERFAWVVERAATAGTWWEQTRLPRQIARARPDVFFAAGYTAPLRLACPLVVTIHDVSFFAHPEWFRAREGWRRRWLTRSAARRARAVVTVSEFSAEEIVRWLHIPRERIVIAPHGAPTPATHAEDSAGGALVLFVGSLFNRRRIPELIEAFAEASRPVPGARLVLVGDNRTHPRLDPAALASAHGVGDRVQWRAYVDEAELGRLYAAARVFVFLSDYEGFAMTPLEAIAHGAAPILLDTPIAREVYGGAALLVPPDPAAIAGALVTLLTDDRAHADLLAAGRRRLARYSWARTAERVLRTLERAAAR